jgi:hypothetical protein
MLRSGQWFPRRAALAIRIAAPVRAGGTDFHSLVRLRDETRAAILSMIDEPDLVDMAGGGYEDRSGES